MKIISLDLPDKKPVEVEIRKHHWAKRMTIKIMPHGQIGVTIPKRVSYLAGEQFAKRNTLWIQQHTPSVVAVQQGPTNHEREEARQVLSERAKEWAEVMNVSFGRIAIKNQRTRWGSCSSKGNLNFNWRATQLPDHLLDYIVVHELAHLKHMNHSPDFYRYAEEYLPNFRGLQKELAKITING